MREQFARMVPIAGEVIRLDGVTKTYQAGTTPALLDVHLSVAAGEVVAIMGPSGSGKSTLLNLVAGLDRPSTGQVSIAGRRIDKLSESALARFRARHVGIVFQFFNLLDDLTVEDNVLLPAQLAGASRRQARARAGELLARMGIAQYRDAYPARMSGGQRQRVAIARALVNRPELLLADEPTGALDTSTGQEIAQVLRELNHDGQTLVLVTHDRSLAQRFAARTVQLVDGQLVSTGAQVPRVSWLGPVRTATGGMRRHLIQAIAIGMVVLISTASATLGLALLAASNSPFRHTFATQHGADVTLTVNPGRASLAQLAATKTLGGVTATAGPFAAATVPVQSDGQPYGPLTLAGRPSAGGPVDDVVLNAGHWPDGLDQVVLDRGAGPGKGDGGLQLGSKLTTGGTTPGPAASGAAGARTLTVVGFANSVTGTADGWVAAGEAARLQALGGTASTQMMYRFTRAGSYAQVRADIAEVTRALPSGAVTGAASWLSAEDNSNSNGAIMEPFVIAFALIGLIMAVLIVGNVISGAVVAQYHRIGVLKSLGLTPAQVAVAYLSRVGWPALAGALIGVVAGYVLAAPVLQQSAGAYGIGHQQVPVWAMLAAPAGILAITTLAALGPSLRAGRLSAVQAITAGRAPRPGHGYAVHRLAARLRLPRPAALGLAAPFARPARAAVTLASIAFGATAVIFAAGLTASLNRAAQDANLTGTVPVQVQPFGPGQGSGPGQGPSAAQDAAVTAALRAQPGTAHEVAVYGSQVTVPGIGGHVYAQAFGGDAAWTSYALISGHWYGGPGEIDVNTAFLTQSGLSVGSPVTVNTGTAQVTLRIAGEVFQPSSGPQLLAATQALPGLGTAANLQMFDVGLRPGTTAASYTRAVNGVLGSRTPWQATPAEAGSFFTVAISLVGLLALMVAAAAGLGVLNTVLMTTRERVHDLGVFKALGMRPRQLLTMVVCWVAGPAVLAGVIAAPAAVVLNSATVHAMAGTAHTGIPASLTQVFPPSRLALLSLAALVIAVAGALLPASWAARARPAAALRTE